MAFVRVDQSRKWVAQPRQITAPQVVQAGAGTTPYFGFDLSQILDQDTVITGTPTVVETSTTFTASDISLSPDAKELSFKSDSLTAGTFTWQATCTLSTGTTQTIEIYGTMKVVA